MWRAGNVSSVLFTFPHWVEFADDFPKGHIVEKTLLTNTYKINAVKLLDWLYKHGHCSYDSKMLVQSTKEFETVVGSIDRLIN